jgi:hypothetical protein
MFSPRSDMSTWLDHYRKTYYPLLNIHFTANDHVLVPGMYNRAVGFDIIFRLLLNQKRTNFSIVETGTLRTPDNWVDGQSARLFTEFVDQHGGHVRSVDIDADACQAARDHIKSKNFSVANSDSVTWLTQRTDLDQVDLFYLDSWDVDWNNDTASAEHHLREFQAIESYLKPGCVVALDDNSRWSNNYCRTGKGRRVVEYLYDQGHLPIYDEYQIIFHF